MDKFNSRITNFGLISFIVVIVIFFLVIFFIGFSWVDPDFGFHYRLGEIFQTKLIWQQDPFTYTMPSYIYKSHEWLSEFIVYRLTNYFGLTGLSLLFSFLTLLAVLIIIPKKLFLCSTIPIILSIGIIESYSGIRLQIISWVFMALLIRFSFDNQKWHNIEKFLPFLFMIWANLHGAFVIGIIVYTIILIAGYFEDKSIYLKSLLIWVISILSTLINPYGTGLWQEILNTILDSRLHSISIEWQPFLTAINYNMIPIIALSIFFFIYSYKVYSLKEKSVYILFCLTSLFALRNFIFWIIISNYIIAKGISYFYKKRLKNDIAKQRFSFLILILVSYSIIIFGVITYKTYLAAKNNLNNEFYPKKAIVYLRKYHPDRRIFTVFQWGGYMIWKYPGYHGFIDGRMPSWKNPNASSNESFNAAEEYIKIIEAKDSHQALLDKYNIELLLLPKTEKKLIKKLSMTVWQQIYQDNITIVYIRK